MGQRLIPMRGRPLPNCVVATWKMRYEDGRERTERADGPRHEHVADGMDFDDRGNALKQQLRDDVWPAGYPIRSVRWANENH